MTLNSSFISKISCLESGIRGPDAPFYRWLALGYVFLFILALTANLRVLFKLFHYSRRRFRDHILLLNLCAADLFFTLVYIPSEIYAYTVGRWHYDHICKIIAALKGLGIYVSSTTIIGISIDRYLSIVHPLTVYQSNTRNKLFVVGSWFISGLASIPQLIIFKRLTNELLCREMCGDILSTDPAKRLAYNIGVAIFAYIAPLLTIFYSYFRILYVLHKRSDRRTFRFVKCTNRKKRYDDRNQTNNTILTSNTTDIYRQRSSHCQQSLVEQEINSHNIKTITRAKLKTLKLTVFIVICFVLCWTPYYCIVFFILITDARIDHQYDKTTPIDSSIIDQSTYNQRSFLIVMMLAVSNSVLDPLIYGCFMVKPIKSTCWNRLRTRTERTTFRRTGNILTGE
ncbi:unnamed protein product [Rotaria sordida]|uniref:G-protein coupled receptors family 1 profile domain-containing protein n=1 Tax=Rotaria sordida TaxID=392033 RepID=A0A813YZB0_9BILA|nr:unnamed protein product [Rotaria sordida]CAF0857979.1 unnamed protein product [Rotaria sordida]CAF0892038.1 unnamed protein product [Rotaria sordida]